MDGVPITGYKYALSTSADNITYGSYGAYTSASWSSGTSFTITGLSNGTYYKIKVRAVNAVGEGTESEEKGAYKPNIAPAAVGAIALTAGDLIDTFSWSAPANNGATITKYGYQVSADDGGSWYSAIGGTLNGESETNNLSIALATQNSTSSYKIRVRAFNNGSNGGWGARSEKSTNATAVWVKGDSNANSYTAQTVTDYEECAAAGCSTCGTQPRRKTRTKEQRKYRWYRSGSTAGAYDADWTDYTSYPDWSTRTCADYGTCNTAGGTWVNINTTFDYVTAYNATGVYWEQDTDRYGNIYVFNQYNQFAGCCPNTCASGACGTGGPTVGWLKPRLYNLEQCGSTGNIRSVEVGCVESVLCNSGGGGS